MAGKRPRVRAGNEAHFVNVFSANAALGWRVISRVRVEVALERVLLKQWREVVFETGELAGVQPVKLQVQVKTAAQVVAETLRAVTITLDEMKRNAGLYGRSRTLGMPEWRRLCRHARFDKARILPPEDATERAIEKVRLWPYPASVIGRDAEGAPIFGDRAVRVYPPAPRNGKR